MDGVPTVTQDDVDELIAFIRNTLEKTGCKGVVIGLSGGLDSAVVTKLCVDALGADKVLNIFMPSGVTISDDYILTKDLSKLWGTEYRIMDIQPAVDSLQSVLLSKEEAPLDRGNISARCRMIVLYNQARKRNFLVMGTSNQSELMMGYFTKFGDGACDVTPLANMYKTQVRELAKLMNRTENAVALRLVNFAACDPYIINSGRTGMPGGLSVCMPYWNEFANNKEALFLEAATIRNRIQNQTFEQTLQFESQMPGLDKMAYVMDISVITTQAFRR